MENPNIKSYRKNNYLLQLKENLWTVFTKYDTDLYFEKKICEKIKISNHSFGIEFLKGLEII
jgi:hypothetical protein